MKKAILVALSTLLLLITLFYIFIYPRLAIISGYNAKNLCSCIFISGFDQEKAEREDLGFGPLNQATNIVDYKERSVSSSVFGLQKKKAFFRDGFGCTLVNDCEINNPQLTNPLSQKGLYSDSTSIGSISSSEIPANLISVVDEAFSETDLDHPKNTRAVVILRDGKILAEKYAQGIKPETPLLGWSMAKSITSLLVGILSKEGKLNTHDVVPVAIWENDQRKKITYRNLLQMNSGLMWEEDYGNVSEATIMLFDSDSMGYFASSRPYEFEPGTYWEYSSGSSNILSWSLADFFPTLEEYQQFPYKKLFGEIGAKSMLMETDAAGYFVGSSYCFASARDWARMGQLCLQEGNWNGNQIIDSSWFKFIREPVKGSEGKYGGQFWLNHSGALPDCPVDMYYMDGFHGQRVFIIPSENMVIVRLGLTYNTGDFDFNKWVSRVIKNAG